MLKYGGDSDTLYLNKHSLRMEEKDYTGNYNTSSKERKFG